LLHIEGYGLYSISFRGEFVVRQSRNAECDLARVLAARGLTGIIRIIDVKTGTPRTFVNITKAAKLTVKEGPYGPRFVSHETVSDRAYSPESSEHGRRHWPASRRVCR
jgi:hypothetical protein